MTDNRTIKKPLNRKKQKEPSNWEIFAKGILKENGIFVMALGLCPALAVTATLEGAFGMGILVLLVLTMTNITVSSIRNFVPVTVRIPIYVIIIATEVTVIKMLVDAFAPELAKELGVFIALITVNCIILGRAEAFASKNSVPKAALDGIGVSLGFALALTMIGFVRELFGTGKLMFGRTLPLGFEYTLFGEAELGDYALTVLADPPGAFLVIGFLLALSTAVQQSRKGARK
ncbi:MAG: electron transport complex subunit RsxE [Acholeplasmataceae bacterium]